MKRISSRGCPSERISEQARAACANETPRTFILCRGLLSEDYALGADPHETRSATPKPLRSKTARLAYVGLLRVGCWAAPSLYRTIVPSVRHAFVQGAHFLCKVPERCLRLRVDKPVAWRNRPHQVYAGSEV